MSPAPSALSSIALRDVVTPTVKSPARTALCRGDAKNARHLHTTQRWDLSPRLKTAKPLGLGLKSSAATGGGRLECLHARQ